MLTLTNVEDRVVPAVTGTLSVGTPRSVVNAVREIGPYERHVKRPFDLVVGGAALVCLAPLLGGVALAVRVVLGAPVVLRQDRVGRGGNDFEMLKFRTMRRDRRSSASGFDGPDHRVTHKSSDDPRHTRLGRFLRSTSLDELPQLVHVVRGEMSLVGPRPEMSSIVDRLGMRGHPRHSVRPGLTGLWQVTHRSLGIPLHESMDIDLEYLEQLSFRTDLSILTRTVRAVLKAEGR